MQALGTVVYKLRKLTLLNSLDSLKIFVFCYLYFFKSGGFKNLTGNFLFLSFHENKIMVNIDHISAVLYGSYKKVYSSSFSPRFGLICVTLSGYGPGTKNTSLKQVFKCNKENPKDALMHSG